MRVSFYYILLIFVALVLPIAILRTALTGIAFLGTLVAVFGAGQAFRAVIFQAKDHQLSALGCGFILFAALALATAFFELNAFIFIGPFIAAACYGIFCTYKFWLHSRPQQQVNRWLVVLTVIILCLTVYPTLQLQGYRHDGIMSWANADALAYTSIANRVKLEIYPITMPGFGIEKLYYHYGAYALAGFLAKIFFLDAGDALFGIVRPLAVLSVMGALATLGGITVNANRTVRIIGALAGFFLVGSLSSIFEYLPLHFARVDHGMKHLRGFVIGHSSLWIFTALVPFMALLHEQLVGVKKISLVRVVLFGLLGVACASLNIVAGAICLCLLAFFLLFYNSTVTHNRKILWRNLALVGLPFLLLLAGIVYLLHASLPHIAGSLFFLPVFDLGTWSNFLLIFFGLYIGLRIFGLNYLFSKTEQHFGYMQYIILMICMCFMLMLGFFVEPRAGRENDIKYGYVILEGTLGIFSGIWLADKLSACWLNRQNENVA